MGIRNKNVGTRFRKNIIAPHVRAPAPSATAPVHGPGSSVPPTSTAPTGSPPGAGLLCSPAAQRTRAPPSGPHGHPQDPSSPPPPVLAESWRGQVRRGQHAQHTQHVFQIACCAVHSSSSPLCCEQTWRRRPRSPVVASSATLQARTHWASNMVIPLHRSSASSSRSSQWRRQTAPSSGVTRATPSL